MKNINNIFKAICVGFLVQFVFADPGWDPAGECVLNNYPDYEFNASITAKIFLDDAESGALGDMIGVFHEDEQRGIGCASEVPVFLGNGFAFLTMVYSNSTGGEILTFQYYDESENSVYNAYSEDGWDDDDDPSTPNT